MYLPINSNGDWSQNQLLPSFMYIENVLYVFNIIEETHI